MISTANKNRMRKVLGDRSDNVPIAKRSKLTEKPIASAQSFSNTAASLPNPEHTEYSVKSLLEGLISSSADEASPPQSLFSTELRNYQKQSLSFMLNAERSTNPAALRGGWLADQVGMGKSAVVLALVASEPLASPPTASAIKEQSALVEENIRKINNWKSEEVMANLAYRQARGIRLKFKNELDSRDCAPSHYEREYYRQLVGKAKKLESALYEIRYRVPRRISKLKLKATVIFTSVSLLGQWEDEAKLHAPGLVVRVCHPSKRSHPFKFLADIEDLVNTDVIITTATFDWRNKSQLFCHGYSFHRVVVDESHSFKQAKMAKVMRLGGDRNWCVTATPCSGSIIDLEDQAEFIGLDAYALRGPWTKKAWCKAKGTFSKEQFDHLIQLLKPLIIRHTKSQEINGSQALALPPSSTSTVFVTMSNRESAVMENSIKTGRAKLEGRELTYLETRGGSLIALKTAVGLHRGYGCTSKLVALKSDLDELKQENQRFRAIVFTQYRESYNQIASVLKFEGYDIYQVDGSTIAAKRDERIRAFQNSTSDRPAVFVVTTRTGNAGITLTAANRVYMMEPSIDPATEEQAAGRIHRLGQKKAVEFKRFAFRSSPEENIVTLHEEIAAGRVSITTGSATAEAFAILNKNLDLEAIDAQEVAVETTEVDTAEGNEINNIDEILSNYNAIVDGEEDDNDDSGDENVAVDVCM